MVAAALLQPFDQHVLDQVSHRPVLLFGHALKRRLERGSDPDHQHVVF